MSLYNISFVALLMPKLLLLLLGLSDIETVMKEDKNIIEHWPDICQEIVHFFHAVHR